MTALADRLDLEARASEATLWSGAALVVLAAHAAALAWMLSAPPIVMADNAPPPAIMIEMAPTPEAINTEVNEISEQMQEAQEIKSETSEPVEKPVEEVKPEEPEPVQEPEPEPIVEQKEVEKAEVTLPVVRPKPEKKPIEKPRKREVRKPERRRPAPASQAAREASAQVQQSTRNAASQTVAGMGFGSVSPAQWQSRLMAHLERRKQYPAGARSRGETGTVYVRFSIDDSGNVRSASLARSSGVPELDAEVLSLVRRASPVPAPPAGVSRTITAPVRFSVR